MKKIIYPILYSIVLGWGCSYDDQSTGPDNPIPDIVIDTTDIPAQHRLSFGEELVIEPSVSCPSNPEKDFSYEWRLGLRASSSTSEMHENYKVAGTEETFRYTIDLLPDNTTYQLWYRVKDNKTKQMRSIMWQILVDASSGQGLLVAHSDDGQTSDLSVIQDVIFTAEFNRSDEVGNLPTNIKRDVFSSANGGRYDGIIHELLFQPRYNEDKRLTNYVDGHSYTNYFRLNTLYFTVDQEGHELFINKGTKIDVRRMIGGSSNSYLTSGTRRIIWNNHAFHKMAQTTANTDPNEILGYNAPSVGSWGGGLDVTYDPDPVFSWGTDYFMFYDRMNGRFLTYTVDYHYRDTPMGSVSAENQPFDPNDMPDLEILEAGFGDNVDHRFIVKNNGSYQILSLTQTDIMAGRSSTARAIIDINDAPEIDKAEHFLICQNQPVVYYSTSTNKLYSILFIDGMGDDVRYNHVYTSADPINGLYLQKAAGSKSVMYNRTALLMTTTANQNEGKVWVIPMAELGTGNIIEDQITCFEGFPRISTVAMIE